MFHQFPQITIDDNDQPTDKGDEMAHDMTHYPDILQKQFFIYVYQGTPFLFSFSVDNTSLNRL